MGERNQPPDETKAQPGSQEGYGEDDEGPSPLGVHQCCEEVLEEPKPSFVLDSGLDDVAVAILEDGAFSQFSAGVVPEGSPFRSSTVQSADGNMCK